MRTMLTWVVVLTCGLLAAGCQRRPGHRAGAVSLVRAIQEDDRRKAGELLRFWWVPLLEDEDRLHIGSRFFFPIHVAAGEGRAAILEPLISKGADVDARDDFGWTPIMWAFCVAAAGREAGRLECLRLLARSGANLEARSRLARETALHRAAEVGNAAFVRELLRLGSNVRARRKDGGTPLHLAGLALLPANAPEPVEVAKLLLQAGADVRAKNDAGQTAEDIARKEGREALAALLREAAKNPPPRGAGKP